MGLRHQQYQFKQLFEDLTKSVHIMCPQLVMSSGHTIWKVRRPNETLDAHYISAGVLSIAPPSFISKELNKERAQDLLTTSDKQYIIKLEFGQYHWQKLADERLSHFQEWEELVKVQLLNVV